MSSDATLKKPRLRFGIDVDGVMYQWDKTARYMLRTEKGYSKDGPLGRPGTHWNSLQENVSKEDWQWLWGRGVKMGLFRYGHLYPGTIEAIRALSALGDIVVITHRPQSAVQDTLDWLSYLRLPFTETYLLTRQQAKSSVPHCDLYVDDKPENITDYTVNTRGHAALWARPWNEGQRTGFSGFENDDADVVRAWSVVNTWEEVIGIARRLHR